MLRSPEAMTVVRGTVKFVQYRTFKSDHFPEPFTVMTVTVDEVLRGRAADTITVWENGGYAPAQAAAFENSEKFPDNPAPAFHSGQFGETSFLGAGHPASGQAVVLVLTEQTASTAPNSLQGYTEVGTSAGRFNLDPKTNTLHRAGSDSGYQTRISLPDFLAILENI